MKKVFAIALTCSCLIVSSCQMQKNANRQRNANELKNNQVTNVRNSNNANSSIPKVDQTSARKIEQIAKKVPDVQDATAIVIGKYSVVGLDVNDKLERSKVGTVKLAVTKALAKDPQGAKAAVVANPDLTARLKAVEADIHAGKPVQGIMNELADIVGRIIPSVPNENKPEATNQTSNKTHMQTNKQKK